LCLQDEKEVLEGVMEWFRVRLQVLDTLEYYQERRLKQLGLLDDNGQTTFEDMVQINV
jgi:[ribulose-bisphosphate carboxylase]/[fructose-bisphosphate aldolase]-lysine N-methyltransferase